MTQTRRSQRLVCLVFVLALLIGASPIFAVTVEEIPDPQPTGWSVDLTGTIPAETRQEIDRLGDEIKAANGAEIAVVWIDSTGGEPAHDFAVRLTNHWGIGDKDKDNGILLLAALSDRRAEIVLGEGLDTPENNQASAEIMQGKMVPLFRAGDPGGALLAGARACARRILDVAPPVAETETPMPLVETAVSTPPPAESPTAPLPYVAPEPATSGPSQSGGLFIAAVLGLGLMGGGYLLMRAPRCGKCRIAMNLMGEAEDDAHLTPVERTEERIGSVDHQIWLCPQCGETKKRSRGFFSRYGHCTSCGAKAAESQSWVIENPTYYSHGTRRVDTNCAHCGHQTSTTLVIPRLEMPRDDSSRRSSSSHAWSNSSSSHSSYSSDSSSSSSSSGSSGYSGGSSSGGGASGSW